MSEPNIGNNRQRVAAELRRVRDAAGMTQEQMATRLGMNSYAPGGRDVSTRRAAISAWESGRRPLPTEYVDAYVRLGADPQILALLADKPPRQGYDAPGGGTTAAAPAEPAVTNRRFARHRLRRWWVVTASLTLVGGIGAAVAASFHSTPDGPAVTWTETTGTPAHTWANATQLTGAGTPLGPRQSVQVSCRVRGYVVQDGDPWWYRLASSPWDGRYYATSDAFYNNGATSGSVDTGVVVDEQVPVCSGD